ncbi:hypothetical protein BD413DRAFT_214542 [Trametes elegans]|nr:hypothetical protein BD413DRAFT_214542 [Trametes elegans]
MSALRIDDVYALGLSLAGVSLDPPATSTTQGTDAAIGPSAPAAQRVALAIAQPQTSGRLEQSALLLSMRHGSTQAEGSASMSAQGTRTKYPCPKCSRCASARFMQGSLCSSADLAFAHSHNRDFHHRSVHEPSRRHLCTVEGCERSFVRRHDLMKHTQLAHRTRSGQRTRQQRAALPAAGHGRCGACRAREGEVVSRRAGLRRRY